MGATTRIGSTAGIAVCLVALGWNPAPAASAPLRVHLVHGSSLEAIDCRIENGRATITLPEGGTLAFPSSLVGRIEQIAPAVPDPPVPGAEMDAAQDAAPPDGGVAPPVSSDNGTATRPVATGAESIDSLIRSAALRHGLEPELLAAVIAVESGYRADAVSPKGARGLMQLMPGTARDLSVTDPFDPRQNIEGGAAYLRRLLDEHRDSWVDALAAYNAGAGRVARYKGLPPYRETITYIERVLSKYRSPQPAPTTPLPVR